MRALPLLSIVSSRLRLHAQVALVLLSSCALGLELSGCGESATTPCETNADCREGFQCGAGPFAGDCIQIVSVTACGADYCEKATEQCQNGACVPRTAGADASFTPGLDMASSAPPPPGDAGPTPPGADARVAPGGDGGGFDDAFVAPPPDPPTVTISTPFDGELIVDRPAELTGRVFGLTPAGRVTFTLDADPTPRPLAVDVDTYRAALDLPPGRHTVTVSATNGGPVGQMVATFRLDAHVLREGDHLTMNGQPWRFIGLQTPDLRELAYQANLGGTDRVPEVLDEAKRLGVRVLRVPACDDRPNAPTAIQTGRGTYNEAGLVALDHVIARAGDAGFKLLLPLVDAGDTLGGINQYLRWNGYVVPVVGDKRYFFEPGPIREHFKNHVRALLGRINSVNGIRYSEDPAILGWEIFTSADALGVYDVASAGAETADFVADLTQVMKAAAPNALAGTGEMGHDVNPSLYGRSVDPFREVGLNGLFDASHGFAWQRNLRAGTVDFGGIQVIPDLLGFAGDPILYANLGAEWIRGHAALAATNTKPFIVTLAAENMVILAPETRRQALSAWLDELTARGFTGFVVGNFHADGFDRRADPHGFAWAENTDAADPQNELVPLVQTAASRLNGP
jgi:hypothetical protein